MTLLLDTNVLAKWGDPTEKEKVVPYLQGHASERFVTSSLVTFEFFRPAKRRRNGQQVRAWLDEVLDGVEPFTLATSVRAAEVESHLPDHGDPLELRDLLIAAHAREVDATFVTFDRGDFQNRAVQQLLDVDVVTP